MLGISSKVDYGIVVLAELAKAQTDDYLSLADIADEKNLSANYLGQLMMPLKDNDLVESKEGKGGGYRLKKKLIKISLADVIRAYEGDIAFVPCLSEKDNCQSEPKCFTKNLWTKVQKDFIRYAEHKSLAELLR